MNIILINKFKADGSWYMDVDDHTNGERKIERQIEIPEKSAITLIEKFGMELQDASGSWETYM